MEGHRGCGRGRNRIPHKLVFDNGRQFHGGKIQEWFSSYNILQAFTFVAYPQSNGQAEITNREIIRGLKTKLDHVGRSWMDELSSVLWTYRTMPQKVTGIISFILSTVEKHFITSQQPLSSSDLKRRVHPSFNNPFIFIFEEKVSFSIDEQPSTSSTAFADRLAVTEAPSSNPLSTSDSKRIWLSLAHYCSWNWRPSDLSKAAQGGHLDKSLFCLGATYRSSTIILRVPFQIF
ncbi:uncharacterized protein LOC122007850 [Zingiber officinale]|uniref:uncharacterized protein LOC122007850 n=1 Tax=Zingiber officinale TaxID=94328 RepID=UPI001C4D513E|nr:uncharacterized protein LOC122007850 [Zingiber officinale]